MIINLHKHQFFHYRYWLIQSPREPVFVFLVPLRTWKLNPFHLYALVVFVQAICRLRPWHGWMAKLFSPLML